MIIWFYIQTIVVSLYLSVNVVIITVTVCSGLEGIRLYEITLMGSSES